MVHNSFYSSQSPSSSPTTTNHATITAPGNNNTQLFHIRVIVSHTGHTIDLDVPSHTLISVLKKELYNVLNQDTVMLCSIDHMILLSANGVQWTNKHSVQYYIQQQQQPQTNHNNNNHNQHGVADINPNTADEPLCVWYINSELHKITRNNNSSPHDQPYNQLRPQQRLDINQFSMTQLSTAQLRHVTQPKRLYRHHVYNSSHLLCHALVDYEWIMLCDIELITYYYTELISYITLLQQLIQQYTVQLQSIHVACQFPNIFSVNVNKKYNELQLQSRTHYQQIDSILQSYESYISQLQSIELHDQLQSTGRLTLLDCINQGEYRQSYKLCTNELQYQRQQYDMITNKYHCTTQSLHTLQSTDYPYINQLNELMKSIELLHTQLNTVHDTCRQVVDKDYTSLIEYSIQLEQQLLNATTTTPSTTTTTTAVSSPYAGLSDQCSSIQYRIDNHANNIIPQYIQYYTQIHDIVHRCNKTQDNISRYYNQQLSSIDTIMRDYRELDGSIPLQLGAMHTLANKKSMKLQSLPYIMQSYYAVLPEIVRRNQYNKKVNNIIQNTNHQLSQLQSDELPLRQQFHQQYGKYLTGNPFNCIHDHINDKQPHSLPQLDELPMLPDIQYNTLPPPSIQYIQHGNLNNNTDTTSTASNDAKQMSVNMADVAAANHNHSNHSNNHHDQVHQLQSAIQQLEQQLLQLQNDKPSNQSNNNIRIIESSEYKQLYDQYQSERTHHRHSAELAIDCMQQIKSLKHDYTTLQSQYKEYQQLSERRLYDLDTYTQKAYDRINIGANDYIAVNDKCIFQLDQYQHYKILIQSVHINNDETRNNQQQLPCRYYYIDITDSHMVQLIQPLIDAQQSVICGLIRSIERHHSTGTPDSNNNNLYHVPAGDTYCTVTIELIPMK